jgi:hypothetical protein
MSKMITCRAVLALSIISSKEVVEEEHRYTRDCGAGTACNFASNFLASRPLQSKQTGIIIRNAHTARTAFEMICHIGYSRALGASFPLVEGAIELLQSGCSCARSKFDCWLTTQPAR